MKPVKKAVRGFTLIEIMIVVVIIGVVPALLYPATASMYYADTAWKDRPC